MYMVFWYKKVFMLYLRVKFYVSVLFLGARDMIVTVGVVFVDPVWRDRRVYWCQLLALVITH